jgi:hypothetical protein
MGKKRRSKMWIIKHGFIYTLFAIFFILIAFGMEALFRDLFFSSPIMSAVAILIGIVGTLAVFWYRKGKVKWT